jgi:hypothetical protein
MNNHPEGGLIISLLPSFIRTPPSLEFTRISMGRTVTL